MDEINAKDITQMTDTELIRELAYADKLSDFYYRRKQEIMKEVGRRG
jgi:hypothetical protein